MESLLYGELARFYHLVDPVEDHRAYAADYLERLRAAAGTVETLLELGSGGGHNALFLKADARCTLSDLSPDMLAISRALNPECEHVQGDMRTLRLGRTFDAVLVHDAICYMTSEADLLAAAETARAHLRKGGAALFAPDCVRETFTESAEVQGGDDTDVDRALRFMMWTRDPNPDDSTYVVDFAFLLREGDAVRALHDQHVEGLFSRAKWRAVLRAAGFEVHYVEQHVEDTVLDLFVCVNPT